MTGRFTAADPIGFAGGDVNLYSYVWNNPASYSDPFGLFSWEDAATLAVGFGDGASFGLTRWIRQQSWYGGDYVNYCSGWYTLGKVAGYAAGSYVTGVGLSRGIGYLRYLKTSRYMFKRMAERGITKKMVDVTLKKGVKYYDRLHYNYKYVIEGGMASGKTISISTSAKTGRIITGVISRNFNSMTKLADGTARYVPIW